MFGSVAVLFTLGLASIVFILSPNIPTAHDLPRQSKPHFLPRNFVHQLIKRDNFSIQSEVNPPQFSTNVNPISTTNSSKAEVCTNEACKAYASQLRIAMDEKVKPCDGAHL
jgi:hypothetical protein